ncbi:50S ribosomal protein L29 [Candidatus Bathyarchaeota archaeon ex4484_40]|nr:MAG: 50S ribosomal protein L29 [Candidatus Bathyarchaeota archaeon ex4484_40]
MIKAGGTIENPSRIREIRKTIARILTVNNEERRKKR